MFHLIKADYEVLWTTLFCSAGSVVEKGFFEFQKCPGRPENLTPKQNKMNSTPVVLPFYARPDTFWPTA